MIISFETKEIQEFPDEIKNFIYDYINSKLLNKKGEELGLKKEIDSLSKNFIKKIYSPSPSYCKNSGRLLFSDDSFNWYQMLKDEIIAGMEEEMLNDYKFTIKNNEPNYTFYNGDIRVNEPKTWGMPLIFCCIFAFGNLFPGMNVAKTTSDIINNFKKAGLLQGDAINAKSVGPLMKSLTTIIKMYAYKTLGKFEGKADAIHWFDFTKKNNEIFFAGDTLDLCVAASKKISEEHFFISNEDFDKELLLNKGS